MSRLSVRPPAWTARMSALPGRPLCLPDKEIYSIFEHIRGTFKEYLENMSSMPGSRLA
jgi:hypothetical protein